MYSKFFLTLSVLAETIFSMRILFSAFLFLLSIISKSQLIDSLNTAKNSQYMTAEEKKMIYEINLLRSNPKGYIQFLQPLFNKANQNLKEYGKGDFFVL